MRRIRTRSGLIGMIVGTLLLGRSYAFDAGAHRARTLEAVASSGLNSFLTEELPDFPRGIEEPVDGSCLSPEDCNVVGLIEDGAVLNKLGGAGTGVETSR